ncbi:MAG: phosphatase PAP2 family protein [Rhodobacteraceae bacterium]|nr:phosphatase PAP2 family protein [Paracoccaceae bacterium]
MVMILRFSLLYVLSSLGLTAYLHADFTQLLIDALLAAATMGQAIFGLWIWLVPLGVAGIFLLGREHMRGRIRPILAVFVASVALQVGFLFFKSAIPNILPYYADPDLARFDLWLHGGVAPWQWLHWLLPNGIGTFPAEAYLNVWSVPALGFPILIVATETDRARMIRFLWLFFGSWFVLGNIIALLGSSVGPVYYDRLIGGDTFAALTAALKSSGIADGPIGYAQGLLWSHYAAGGTRLNLGISAFPSMHVAVATITMLYLWERSKWLRVPGVLFLLSIVFLSVYSGFHYAIDGYFSFAAVLLGNWAIKRRMVPAADATLLRAIAA